MLEYTVQERNLERELENERTALGVTVQVDPIKPTLTPPGIKRLKLKH
jgi:hypothetical protein